jgi:hypothetical protein
VKSSMGSEIVYQACVSMQRKATGKVSVGNKIWLAHGAPNNSKVISRLVLEAAVCIIGTRTRVL